jgi:kynureninase
MDDVTDRAAAEALDAADPLAGFRERFVVGDEPRIYLDGNSLGRMPLATRDRLQALAQEWAEQLVGGWHDWIDAPVRAGDLLAPVLGAGEGEVIVTDSVTINLFKLVNAVADARGARGRGARAGGTGTGALITDRANFPTDRYVLEGIAAARGLDLKVFDSDPLYGPQPDDLAACRPGDVVVLSHVAYRSGALADMAALTAAAHARGATLIWDLSHSAGAVAPDLTATGAEVAVGCTYKYLNGGPGAPAFIYVARELQGELRSPIWGWFAQSDQFAMERDYDPVEGIGRFLAGTPPILQLAAVEEGARLIAEAGIERLREKSIAQCELLIALADEWLAPLGFEVGSPREAERRGSHVSLRHEQAWPINRALIERAHVIGDFRVPDVLRLGIAPIYTRYVDVYDAIDRLRGLVERGEHLDFEGALGRVT